MRVFFLHNPPCCGHNCRGQAVNYVKLMGMIEFKRPLSSLPIWIATMQRNMRQPIFKPGYMFNGKGKISWDTFRDRASPKQGKDLLRFVHQYWNTKPYRSDRSIWGVDDYWEAPNEFIKNSGDCEDYAITKYFTLKALGFPISQMRIGVMKDPVREISPTPRLSSIWTARLFHGQLEQRHCGAHLSAQLRPSLFCQRGASPGAHSGSPPAVKDKKRTSWHSMQACFDVLNLPFQRQGKDATFSPGLLVPTRPTSRSSIWKTASPSCAAFPWRRPTA
ncbi:MAG: transglutaminase-like cysteine peptidase [bacterium]|nr:transglutaminase-like cysteine peptidase [bacterium]